MSCGFNLTLKSKWLLNQEHRRQQEATGFASKGYWNPYASGWKPALQEVCGSTAAGHFNSVEKVTMVRTRGWTGNLAKATLAFR